eukprot:Hpha_TRINITY_DN10159_c0_g1::TRINITY_DN10159_c0_g1_i1::g.131720::m.131720/K13720/NAAA; N-acylethanolamine-hydrolysing acid amidase
MVAVSLFVGLALFATMPDKQLETYDISLDDAPEKRWLGPALQRKDAVRSVFLTIADKFGLGKGNITDEFVDALVDGPAIPDTQRKEMQGLALVLNVSYKVVLAANSFYELEGLTRAGVVGDRSCTSIVARHTNGTMFLARNQDYPKFLQPLLYTARVYSAGMLLYQATTFAGTVGVGGTCVVPGHFAVSIDARSAHPPPLDKAIAAAKAGAAVFPFLTRSACEGAGNYVGTVDFLSASPMIYPGYFILAGAAPGQGSVVTVNSSAINPDVWTLDKGLPADSSEPWFLVETNYDHQNPPPTSDDRRDVAIGAMEAVTADDVSMQELWNVLSIDPVFNNRTIHTDLTVPASGLYMAFPRNE